MSKQSPNVPSRNLLDELNLVREEDYAKLRNVKITALQNERALAKGPPFVRLGGAVFYKKVDLLAFIVASTVDPAEAASTLKRETRRATKRVKTQRQSSAAA